MQVLVDKFFLLSRIPIWYMELPRRHCYLFSAGQKAARQSAFQAPKASCPSCRLLILGFDNAPKARTGSHVFYFDGSKK
jgi:hypothetical protein